MFELFLSFYQAHFHECNGQDIDEQGGETKCVVEGARCYYQKVTICALLFVHLTFNRFFLALYFLALDF